MGSIKGSREPGSNRGNSEAELWVRIKGSSRE
jgi:hypothetical protein